MVDRSSAVDFFAIDSMIYWFAICLCQFIDAAAKTGSRVCVTIAAPFLRQAVDTALLKIVWPEQFYCRRN